MTLRAFHTARGYEVKNYCKMLNTTVHVIRKYDFLFLYCINQFDIVKKVLITYCAIFIIIQIKKRVVGGGSCVKEFVTKTF